MAWFLNGWFLNCWFLMGRRQWGLEAGRQVEKEGAVTKIEQGRNEGGRGRKYFISEAIISFNVIGISK